MLLLHYFFTDNVAQQRRTTRTDLDNGLPNANTTIDGEITINPDEFDFDHDTQFLDDIVLQPKGHNTGGSLQSGNDDSGSTSCLLDGDDEPYDASGALNDGDDWGDDDETGQAILGSGPDAGRSLLDSDSKLPESTTGICPPISDDEHFLHNAIAEVGDRRSRATDEQRAQVRARLYAEIPRYKSASGGLHIKDRIARLHQEMAIWDDIDRKFAAQALRLNIIGHSNEPVLTREQIMPDPGTTSGTGPSGPGQEKMDTAGTSATVSKPLSGPQLVNSGAKRNARCEITGPGHFGSNNLHGPGKPEVNKGGHGAKKDQIPVATIPERKPGCCDKCGWCWGDDKHGNKVHHRTLVEVEAECRDKRKQHQITIHRYKFRFDNRTPDHGDKRFYIEDRYPYWLSHHFYHSMAGEANNQLGKLFPFDIFTKIGVIWNTQEVEYQYDVPGWGNETKTRTVLPHQMYYLDEIPELTQPMHQGTYLDAKEDKVVWYDSIFRMKINVMYDYKDIMKRLCSYEDNLFNRRMKNILWETKESSDMGRLARILYAVDEYQRNDGDSNICSNFDEDTTHPSLLFNALNGPEAEAAGITSNLSKSISRNNAKIIPTADDSKVKPATNGIVQPEPKKKVKPQKKKQDEPEATVATKNVAVKAVKPKDDDPPSKNGKKPKFSPPEIRRPRRDKSRDDVNGNRRPIANRLGPRQEKDDRPRYLYDPKYGTVKKYSTYHENWRQQ